jgi:hypothetical protein
MNVAIFTPIRNEKRIIEFIKYYLKIGIKFFYFFDDNDDSSILANDLIQNNIDHDKYYIATRTGNHFECLINRMNGTYKDSSVTYSLEILKKKNIDYILIVDADEFLVLNKFKNLNEVIEYYSPFDLLKINWLIFSSKNLKYNKTNSLIKTFNYSYLYLNHHVKSLVKLSSIDEKNLHINPHFVILKKNKNNIIKNILNNDSELGPFEENLTKFKYNEVNLYLAHIYYQDFETFMYRRFKDPDNRMINSGFNYENHPYYIYANKNFDLMVDYFYLIKINKNNINNEEIKNIEICNPEIINYKNLISSFLGESDDVIENNDLFNFDL